MAGNETLTPKEMLTTSEEQAGKKHVVEAQVTREGTLVIDETGEEFKTAVQRTAVFECSCGKLFMSKKGAREHVGL